MKTIKSIALILTLFVAFTGLAQEKKIKFDKGVLRICSAKNFEIKGYDGNEVIIKSLHEKRESGTFYSTATVAGARGESKDTGSGKLSSTTEPTVATGYYFRGDDKKKGLKKLGKNAENEDLGIYFLIEVKDGELIFKDEAPKQGTFTLWGGERYEVQVPNSVKIQWTTGSCEPVASTETSSTAKAPKAVMFYDSNPSSISDFEGELEISSTLNNFKLKDVVGPVTINTIGGNVTVEFDKKTPTKLYSIYSNNGFIDMQIPEQSSLAMDVIGKSVYSDLDFDVLSENEVNDFGHVKTAMKLKLGKGKVKMMLDAGYGSIYLRKP